MRLEAVFYSVVVQSLISPRDVRLPFIQECLSASASCRKSPRRWFSVWFTTADWWCRPKREGKWKMCLGFFFSPLDRREEERWNSSADKHVIISLYVIQALAHSKQSRKLGAHTRNLSSSLDQTHTHTYIMLCCGLNGWTERRASFAKVSVLDRLRRGDEWLIEAQQGCRGNN